MGNINFLVKEGYDRADSHRIRAALVLIERNGKFQASASYLSRRRFHLLTKGTKMGNTNLYHQKISGFACPTIIHLKIDQLFDCDSRKCEKIS